jgi:hypothetical protein
MRRTILLAASLLLATTLFAGTGKVLVINSDAPGTGFNDPTPVTPVGGNQGTTLGEQRYNVYLKAAERWSDVLDTNVDIRVRGGFLPLECTANAGVLGQTSVVTWSANFAGAPRANIWYPSALANKFAGVDIEPTRDDMVIQFNSKIGAANCLADQTWYYGFDNNAGDRESFFHVVLHEMGHGLGISSRGTTDFFMNQPSVFDLHTLDVTVGLHWDQMSLPQRNASLTNNGNVVWDGENVNNRVTQYLQAATLFSVSQPSAATRDYGFGTAAFGPSAFSALMDGRIVAGADAVNEEGPAATDGCTAFTNAASLAGNIALVDRGTCPFVQKARNAQAAGATGLIVVDNAPACAPPGMGGSANDVTIPVISVKQDEGAVLRAQAQNGDTRGLMHVDPSRRAGTSEQGYVRLYAPCEFSAGSSKHHWDTTASPNLLMEPFINGDLLDNLDLSVYQLLDMGWTLPPRTGRRFLKR